jgi:hypothetical protein
MTPRKERPKYTLWDGVKHGLLFLPFIPLVAVTTKAPAFLPLIAVAMFVVTYSLKPSAKG